MSAGPFVVVIVDDSPDDRTEVRRLLLRGHERRYRLIEAETGAEGIAACLACEGGPPDCVILDYGLPDLDAAEVLAALREGGPITLCPVVVLTGGDTPARGAEVLRAGAQDYLSKSWMNAEILVRALENAVERHRMTREALERTAALQQGKERLRLALQASDTGLWALNVQTDVITWSPECFHIHGFAPGAFALTGAAYIALIHPDDRARVEAESGAAIESGALFESEMRIVRPDGEIVWVANRGRVSFDLDGKPLQLLGTTTDVSRRRRAEEALREADQRKDVFLAMLAHELRNPLAPLTVGLALLERAGPGEDTGPIRRPMERQLTHLVRLVDDLLDASRINHGKLSLVRRTLELREVALAAVESSRHRLEAAQHTFSLELPETPLWVDGDLARLVQVLCNLLDNAAKFTPAQGRIALSVEARGDEAELRVSDSGSGIAPEMLPLIFELFIQIDRTLSRAQGGLGIGLALVRKLVELHGGRVTVESEGLGRGSSFIVRLPLAAGVDEPPRGEAPLPRPPRPRRVMVVDDNVDAADSLAALLEVYGHEAQAFHDGPQALAAALERSPEVFILDIGMPGMDGHELARRLRAEPRHAGALLIALTGWASEDDRRRSADAGFDHHLAKPADPRALGELIAAWAGAPSAAGP